MDNKKNTPLGNQDYFYTPTGYDSNNNQNNVRREINQHSQYTQVSYSFATPNPSSTPSKIEGNVNKFEQYSNDKDDYYFFQGRKQEDNLSSNQHINSDIQQSQQQQQQLPKVIEQQTPQTTISETSKPSVEQKLNYPFSLIHSDINHGQVLLTKSNYPNATPMPNDKQINLNSEEYFIKSGLTPSNPAAYSANKPVQNVSSSMNQSNIRQIETKQTSYPDHIEDLQSAEGEEEPSYLEDGMLSPLKSKRLLSGSNRLTPQSKIFQASNNIVNKSNIQGILEFNTDDEDKDQDQNSKIQKIVINDQNNADDNEDCIKLSLNSSSTNNNNSNRQSIFHYDPALYQSVAGYFFPSQNAENKFNIESILFDINEGYKNNQTYCNYLKQLVKQYFEQQDRQYIQRINREISGLQGAENLGDYFIRKYNLNREKRVAGCSHAQKYPVYIGVRGDGNCFYRALIVSYIAGMLGNSERVCELENLIEDIYLNKVNLIELQYQGAERNDSDVAKGILIQQLVLLLLQRKKSQDQTEVSVLLMSFFENVSRDHDFDYSLVLLCRSMLLTAVNDYSNQSPYVEYILPDEADRTRDNIRSYKEDAEYHVISLSTEIFKIPIQIISLQKDKLGHFEFFEGLSYSPQIGKLNTQASPVNLLLSDGHYDLLFDRPTCLEYFPSLALFNNHQLYQEDLALFTQDQNTPLEIRAACSLRLIEYDNFLKDQENQIIKTKQSQANLQSLYNSKIRNSFTPVNNPQGQTMVDFPRQGRNPALELIDNPYYQDPVDTGLSSMEGSKLLNFQNVFQQKSQQKEKLNQQQQQQQYTQQQQNQESNKNKNTIDVFANSRLMSDSQCGIIELDSEAGSIIKQIPINEKIPFCVKNKTNIDHQMITPNPYGQTSYIPSLYINIEEEPLLVDDSDEEYPSILHSQQNSQQQQQKQEKKSQDISGQQKKQPFTSTKQQHQGQFHQQKPTSNQQQQNDSTFYLVESDRKALSKLQKITPMGDKLDEGTKKSLKKAEQQKYQVPICIHASEASISITSVMCCKLNFEICYPCFKTRQITLCPSCKKDVLSSARIISTAKNCKLSCKSCQRENTVVPLFNQVYCVICDLPQYKN